MRLSVSEARARLGHLIARCQDPREEIILTRHGRPIAALISIEEVKRIWSLQDRDRSGIVSPLSGMRMGGRGAPVHIFANDGLVMGKDKRFVTKREAALQMQEIQLTRAAERKILAAGGLDPVDGGELTETRPATPARNRPGPWARLRSFLRQLWEVEHS